MKKPSFILLFLVFLISLFPVSHAFAGYWLTSVAAMNTPRILSSAAAVSGKLYVIGGYQEAKAVGGVEQYDPASNTWTAKSVMPSPLFGAGTATVDGKIYVIGGTDGMKISALVEVYDPSSGAWSSKTPMPQARALVSTAVMNGKIYVMGGSDGSATLRRVEIYDPASDSWSTATDMPTARNSFGACVSGGLIFAVGGAQGDAPITSVEAYDPASNTWSSKAPLSVGRDGLAVVTSDDGTIWAIAGESHQHGYYQALASVETYEPKMNTWTTQQTVLNTARRHLSAVMLNGRIYAIGGDGISSLNGTTSVEALDIVANGGNTFDVTSSTSGGDGNLNLGAILTAASQHVGLNGEVYVMASYRNQWFFNNGKAWQFAFSPYFSGKIASSMSLPVASGADLSAYPGLDVYVGYGLGGADMLSNGRYKRIHSVSWQGLKVAPMLQGGGHGDHSIVLKSDGTIWAWGKNDAGQIGLDSAAGSSTPVQLAGLDGIVAVSSGSVHSLALRKDGTVWVWGSGYAGQLGSATVSNTKTPLQVFGLTDVVAIASGTESNLALKSDGTIWAWGSGSSTPTQIPGLSGAVSIAAGQSNGFALMPDGTVRAWGWNNYGQLGDGTMNNSTVPKTIPELGGVIQLASAWDHTVALKSDGTVWAWGGNNYGQLGNATMKSTYTPVQVVNMGNVTAIATGNGHTLALKADGTVWGWGANGSNELGIATAERCAYIDWMTYISPTTISCSTSPIQIVTLDKISAIGVGGEHSLALKSDGTVWAWGGNKYGQLGDGTSLSPVHPIQVRGPGGKDFLKL